jgi:cell division protein FtsB
MATSVDRLVDRPLGRSRQLSMRRPDLSPNTPMKRRGRLPRPVWHLALALVLVIVGGLVGLLPFATRSAQNQTYRDASARLATLQIENSALAEERDLLQTDEEVARIAREEFGLAPEGADVYAIPDLRPGNEDRERGVDQAAPAVAVPERSAVDKIIDTLVFWD